MISFRFLHCADLHLDTPFKGMSGFPDSIRRVLRDSTFAALQNIVQIALTAEVDFVLIAGDIYDAADRSLRAQLFLQREMDKLTNAGIPVFIVHGNHDPENGSKARLAWPKLVRFISSRQAETIRLTNRLGQEVACLSGISYDRSAETGNLAERLVPEGELYKIALLHANVDGDPAHDNYAPCTLGQLAASGFDYWALGHIHTRGVLREYPHVVYPGNTQGRSVRETGPKGCYVVDVTEPGETKPVFFAADAVRWMREELVLDKLVTEQDLHDEMERHIADIRERAEGRHAIVRLCFTGRTALYRQLRRPLFLQELVAELRGEEERRFAESGLPFVWIESVEDRCGTPLDLAALSQQEDFIAVMLQLADKLLADRELLEQFCAAELEPLLASKAARYLEQTSAQTRQALLRQARELAADVLIGDAGWDE